MQQQSPVVSGRLFMYHAFDIGEEIDLTRVQYEQLVPIITLPLAKYFKSYHAPLSVALPSCPLVDASRTIYPDAAKLHNFGAITLRYKLPFYCTLDDLRARLIDFDEQSTKQSKLDAGSLFNAIQSTVKHGKFFHIHNSYALIQVDQLPEASDINAIKKLYGDAIAALLRFETETLSASQQEEILADATSYYHKDVIIVDTQATLLCDDEYEEVLDLFEFANIQHLELQYFDRLLDKQLNTIYEHEQRLPVSWSAYIPFIGTIGSSPIGDLNKLKVDISVITDRLETSIKLAGEEYISKLYHKLSHKLDLTNWKDSIMRKLSIIHDVSSIYQHALEVTRQDILTCAIIILIMLELAIGVLNVLR